MIEHSYGAHTDSWTNITGCKQQKQQASSLTQHRSKHSSRDLIARLLHFSHQGHSEQNRTARNCQTGRTEPTGPGETCTNCSTTSRQNSSTSRSTVPPQNGVTPQQPASKA